MRIFLSYASEQTREAELLKPKLENEGHRVFFAPDSLRSGLEYEKTIRKELRKSHLLLFLVSPESVQLGGYARTELKHYQEFHPKPHGRVLPVVVKETELDLIPGYLQAVTLLTPKGSMVAEVIQEVSKIAAERKRRVLQVLSAVALAAIFVCSGVCAWLPRPYHALLLVPWTGVYDHLSEVTSLRVHFGETQLYTVTDLKQQTICLAPAQQLARAKRDAQTGRWIKDVEALSGNPLTDQDQKILKALSSEPPWPLEVEGMQGNETIQVDLVSSKEGKETVERVDRFIMDGRPGLQIHLLSRSGGAQ